ncbi:MAG: nucleotidyltransferase [Acidimicrobiales bacterium]
MSVDLSEYFGIFLGNISLGEPQVGRMNSAADTVSEFLIAKYRVSTANVFLQGSYANHTAIEPVNGGEYDIDIVAVCVGPNVSSDSALDQLEATFRSDGRFRDRVKRKKPCVRLEYANDDVGSFHVDVVPTRMFSENGLLEAPRRGEGWKPTAPSEYTNWCEQRGPLFMRTVMAMKRWRDEQQSVRTAVKSIVLQVLVSQCMTGISDDASRMTQVFRSLYEGLRILDRPPSVPNPVLPSENLAEKWTNEHFDDFVRELGEAVEYVSVAESATDYVEAADLWRELLGDDFPVLSPSQVGLKLLDFSHAQTAADMGWSDALDPQYAVSLTATVQRGKRGQNLRPLSSDGPLVFQDHNLHFQAHVVAPNHVEVWWQVANTGGHARSRGGLRGEIFKGRNLKKKRIAQTENWETTAYTGSHLIRALLVRDRKVVAVSPWFRVNIYAKNQPFMR